MESILSFLADYYLYFLIGAVVLLFALIGFAVDGKKKKKEENETFNPLGVNQMSNSTVNQNVQGVPNANESTLKTGFAGFTNESPNPVNLEIPTQTSTQEQPNLDNLNGVSQSSEETLTFGPIENNNVNANNNEESIFAVPPVVENNMSNDNSISTSNEPVMESLDLTTPQMSTPEMPVSMQPEQPVIQQQETQIVSEPTAMNNQNVVEPPIFNNTIQQ